LEKETKILKEENSKLKRLAKSQVENIIEPAAKKGDVGAIQVIGECFQHGLGDKKVDEKAAQEYYEKGAAANSPSSQCSLGSLLLEQDDDEKATERGVELLKKSAADYPEAQHELALCEWNGTGVQEDEKSAVELWKKAVNNGFAKSQYQLADCFEDGIDGVERDLGQAEHWYLKAAERGDVDAQLSLGRIYQTDENLKDMDKSIEWYERAYYNGRSNEAAAALRKLFTPSNKSEVADLEKAIEWAYRERNWSSTALFLNKRPDKRSLKSTIKGLYRADIHREACASSYNNLALKCNNELEIPLFRRSAVLGNSFGMYYYARDLSDRHPKKLEYIRRSAEDQDNPCPRAQWELGMFYETGRCGLVTNPILAKEWKDNALARGYKPPA
jgi:TPR repeat protein